MLSKGQICPNVRRQYFWGPKVRRPIVRNADEGKIRKQHWTTLKSFLTTTTQTLFQSKNLREGETSCIKAKLWSGKTSGVVDFLSRFGDWTVSGDDRCGEQAKVSSANSTFLAGGDGLFDNFLESALSSR